MRYSSAAPATVKDDDFVDATAFFKSGKVRKRLILSQETCLYMHDTFGEEGFTHI
jgi:hypothetical protein